MFFLFIYLKNIIFLKSLSEVFISERNLIVLSYDSNQSEENIVDSILSRLLIIMAKNIIPLGILVLGVGKNEQTSIEKIHKNLNKRLNNIQKEIKKNADIFLK